MLVFLKIQNILEVSEWYPRLLENIPKTKNVKFYQASTSELFGET